LSRRAPGSAQACRRTPRARASARHGRSSIRAPAAAKGRLAMTWRLETNRHSLPWPASLCRDAFNEAERLESLAEHGRRIGAEPLLDQRRIDAPEIRRRLEIVAEHELGQAGRLAVLPTLDGAADHEVDL